MARRRRLLVTLTSKDMVELEAIADGYPLATKARDLIKKGMKYEKEKARSTD